MERARTRMSLWCRTDVVLLREVMAEFLGTAFLLAMGDGSVAQSVLSRGALGGALQIHLSWGLAVTFGVYLSGGVTGGHLNPSISLAMWVLGRLSTIRLLLYSLAQYLGALFGAALVFAVYYDALNAYDGGNRQVLGDNGSAGIFATYPQEFLSAGGGLGDQIFGTAILSLCVLAITDPKNMGVPRPMIPVLVGLVVVVIGNCYGFNCGYAINPARDLGPRIFTAMAGWGTAVFSHRDYNWFWIPIVGPYVGAVLGALSYQLCVGNHWPEPKIEEAKSGETQSERHSSLDVNLSAIEANSKGESLDACLVKNWSISISESSRTQISSRAAITDERAIQIVVEAASLTALFGVYYMFRRVP